MQSLEKVNGKFTKSGRELQGLLGSTSNHTKWVGEQINKLHLVDGLDFFPTKEKSTGGRPKTTYYFTEAAAHRIAGRNEVNTESAAMVKDNFTMSKLAMQGNEDAILMQAMGILQGRVKKMRLEMQGQAKQLV